MLHPQLELLSGSAGLSERHKQLLLLQDAYFQMSRYQVIVRCLSCSFFVCDAFSTVLVFWRLCYDSKFTFEDLCHWQILILPRDTSVHHVLTLKYMHCACLAQSLICKVSPFIHLFCCSGVSPVCRSQPIWRAPSQWEFGHLSWFDHKDPHCSAQVSSPILTCIGLFFSITLSPSMFASIHCMVDCLIAWLQAVLPLCATVFICDFYSRNLHQTKVLNTEEAQYNEFRTKKACISISHIRIILRCCDAYF